MGHRRLQRIDYMIWLLTQIVEKDFKRERLQIELGFCKNVQKNKEDRKRKKNADDIDIATATEWIEVMSRTEVINFTYYRIFWLTKQSKF